jgi:hypothetical protein
MTRKSFALIASAIACSSLDANNKTTIAVDIAKALATTNDAFDFDRFYEACAVDPTDNTWTGYVPPITDYTR